MESSVRIEAIVSILIKLGNKINLSGKHITLEDLHESLTYKEIHDLEDIIIDYNKLTDEDKSLLLVTFTVRVMEDVNSDLDTRNVAALIHLKVTLLKLLGYTLSGIVLISVGSALFTGDSAILSSLGDIWTLLETMFLK